MICLSFTLYSDQTDSIMLVSFSLTFITPQVGFRNAFPQKSASCLFVEVEWLNAGRIFVANNDNFEILLGYFAEYRIAIVPPRPIPKRLTLFVFSFIND